MDFQSNFITANKSILIPQLQRDYVQGEREDVISPFLDALLDPEKPCDLNYIYGYDEGDGFIPVDGQQRLITLWLLYLYVYTREGHKEDFKTELKFLSREYAESFCHMLVDNLDEALLKRANNKDDLRKVIENESWFISSWSENKTVDNMLRTLNYIHQKISVEQLDAVWRRLIYTQQISFRFNDMGKDNGLDDDIYMKMNGRGRLLTPFENLKSWMDGQIEGRKRDEEWRIKMDNEWTQLFWKNRDKGQSAPEEIADEQLCCFNNLLALYHLKSPTGQKKLLEHLHLEPSDSSSEISNTVIESLRKGVPIPLVWIERLQLIPEDFYPTAMEWLDQLYALYPELNELGLYLGSSDSNTTITHRLGMTKSSPAGTLPLLYSVLSYRKDGVTSLRDWMRTMRNLILNSTIKQANLSGVLSTIEKLADQSKDRDLYEILYELDEGALGLLSPFSESQIREEVRKADPKLAPYRESYFMPLENVRLFQGDIEILLRLMSHEPSDELEEWSEANCKAYTGILMELFGDESKLCTTRNEGDKFLLHRALMTYPPYRFGRSYRSVRHSWQFCSKDEEWRGYFDQQEESYADLRALISLIKDIRQARANGDNAPITELLQKRITSELQSLEQEEYDAQSDFYRYFFIKYPEVWTQMGSDLCCFWDTIEEENNFSIQLREHQTARTKYTDLRTVALYAAYNDGENNPGWHANLSAGVGEYSCLYMDKELRGRTVAIDAYYWTDGDRIKSVPADGARLGYTLDLFVRPLKEDQSMGECKKENEDFFSGILSAEVREKLFINEEHYGRYSASHLYTRSGIEDLIRELMSQIDEVKE